MKALIVKENCKIYAAEVPEEPEYCRAFKGTECQGSRCNCVLDKIMYNRILTSSKESAVLVINQERATRLIFLHIPHLQHLVPGIYPIPDLQWEVKESWGPYHENTFPEKVAILKESTPYNQNLKEVSKGELLNIIKEKCDQLEQEDKSRRLAANPEAVFVRAGESTLSTEQESQEKLWLEAQNLVRHSLSTYSNDLVYHLAKCVIKELKKHYIITNREK